MRPEFERTVEGCDYNVRSKFASILNTLHGTVSVLTTLLSLLFSVVCMGCVRHGTISVLTTLLSVLFSRVCVECVRHGAASVVTTLVHASQYCVHSMW